MDSVRYKHRYPFLHSRRGIWQEIVKVITKDTPNSNTVVELGAGYCDFINEYPAQQKFAYDINGDMAKYANNSVEFRHSNAVDLEHLEDESVDLIFASNFLEHIPMPQVSNLLYRSLQVLRPGGCFAVIQPNFRYCASRYFEDETHVSIFSDESLSTMFLHHDFRMKRIEPGFLPFSMKSRLPKWPVLVRTYLNSPIRPFAAQMYLVAEKIPVA